MEDKNINDIKPEDTAENTGAESPDTQDQGAQNSITVWQALFIKKKVLKTLPIYKQHRVLFEIKDWAVSIIFALVAVYILKTFLVWPIAVSGSSMNPTLEDKERVLVTSYDVRFGSSPKRGDVVICHYPSRTSKWLGIFTVKTDFVKRVVAVEGDTVKRVNGVTYVNDFALDPRAQTSYSATYVKNEDGSISYFINGVQRSLTDEQTYRYKFDYEYTLGEGEYFVSGDNRYNSHDSRAWNGPDLPAEPSTNQQGTGAVGPITKSMIAGHVRSVIFPFKDGRAVENDPNYLYPTDR
ncbi:MAG: signal peptidase I [Clostridia bacterium]|nr:signal peptidase I [Clostridia bacterium]MBR5257744.1 signal peptidase I [Clostridia bacterium]